MTTEARALFEEHIRMPHYVYSKLYKTEIVKRNKEDIIQEGYLGLACGCEHYSEERGQKPYTFLFLVVKNHMLKYIRKLQKINYNDISLYTETTDDEEAEDDGLTFAGTLTYQDDVDFSDMFIEDILKLYSNSRSNKREDMGRYVETLKTILIYIVQGYKVTEIAEKLNISKQRVSTMLKTLKPILEKNNISY